MPFLKFDFIKDASNNLTKIVMPKFNTNNVKTIELEILFNNYLKW